MTTIGPLDLPAGHYGLRQVVRSEVTKLASLRSTLWTLLVTVVGTLGVTILATRGDLHHSRSWYRGFDPTNQSLTGLALGTLAIGVLGVLAVTGEYGSGTIRSSLAAAPRRPLLLAGKVIVAGGLALVVGEVLTFACFGVGQAILSSGGAPSATLADPGVLRAVALSGAFLALLGLLGVGLGMIIRHTAGAIAGFVGITFLLPILLGQLPGTPGRFAPEEILASSVAAVVSQSGELTALAGFFAMVLYCAAVLGLGAVLFVRRDA